MPYQDENNVMLSIRVPESFARAVKLTAYERGLKVYQLVRLALEHEMHAEKGAPDATA